MSNRITDHDTKEEAHGADQDLDLLSSGDFAMLGIHDFAYVRAMPHAEEESSAIVFGVFTADGTHIASFESCAVANAAIRQHDMDPRSVH
ncbi:DUF1150 family protein [Thalassospira alkalitolerans]|uniref:DUF1150 family protein n=1 Tax=Thalassospira alkalitolerans TaxID=1293890 RepID=A0A1Y2LIB8_9PROT|nr:DUF1150 family protein [Thalassospira alkalitolerans]OSQ50293.1 hypothetical protein TALK_02215 [Thalassospira alkalitolerans]|tara:strand:+ start:9512 stop:9781 length:270 start_codon:yes stop_codon:yes gene_type:complete